MSNFKVTPPKSVRMRSSNEAYHARNGIRDHGPIAFKAQVAKVALEQGAAKDEFEAVEIADEEFNHSMRIKSGYILNEQANKNLNAKKKEAEKNIANNGLSGNDLILA